MYKNHLSSKNNIYAINNEHIKNVDLFKLSTPNKEYF